MNERAEKPNYASRIVLNFYYKLIHFLCGAHTERKEMKNGSKNAQSVQNDFGMRSDTNDTNRQEPKKKHIGRHNRKRFRREMFECFTASNRRKKWFFDHFEFGLRVPLICFIMCHAFKTPILFPLRS